MELELLQIIDALYLCLFSCPEATATYFHLRAPLLSFASLFPPMITFPPTAEAAVQKCIGEEKDAAGSIFKKD